MNQLPTILKKARQALDLTQEDVAKKLGISQRAYAFYEDESNGRLPKRKRMEDLGRVLHIPIKTLLRLYSEGVEENPSTPEGETPATNGHALPGSVTLQDHIDLLKKQAATAEADKDRLFNNNETLARALEKLGNVYELILVSSNETKGQLDGIVDQVRAEHAVMMDALDRLEKNKVGTSAMQAGNLEIERKNVRAGKGKQVGAGK